MRPDQAPSGAEELQDLQSRFAHALLDSGSIDQALSIWQGAGEVVRERLAFYRGNLTALWVQVLSNAYPVLQQLVGSDYFEQLAREYGRAHPSLSGDLNCFGASLPDFLRQLESAADYPYFADVAALEWTLHCAHYAEDAPLLDLAGMAAQAQRGAEDLRLEWHPACRLLSSEWAIAPIWQAHQPGGANYEGPIQAHCYCAVSRPHWRAEVLTLPKADWLALQALRQGRTLSDALEMALQEAPEFDIGARLSLWLAAGMFSRVLAADSE